jgi:hypothetical protein
MRNTAQRIMPFLALLVAGTCSAQNPEPAPSYYKLDFVLKEVEGGKVLNSRAYSMIVSTDKSSSASIRTNSKVPISTVPGQFTYSDIGVNIDCNSIREVQRELSLVVSADVTNTQRETPGSMNPVIRSNRWTSRVVVPLKRSTTLFSSDDNVTKGQLQLELTATLIVQPPN